MADSNIILKANLYSLAIKKLTGEEPIIIYYKDRAQINFTKSQAIKIQKMLTSKETPDVKINLFPVILPIIAKKVLLYTAITLISGYIVGKLK